MTEKTLLEEVQEFVSTEGLRPKELYFFQDELPFGIPEGKVVRVTLEYVSLARMQNRPEV